jgi:hypothetical protein
MPFADVFHAPYYAILRQWTDQKFVARRNVYLRRERRSWVVPSGHYFLKWESRAGNGPDGEVSVWRSVQSLLWGHFPLSYYPTYAVTVLQ